MPPPHLNRQEMAMLCAHQISPENPPDSASSSFLVTRLIVPPQPRLLLMPIRAFPCTKTSARRCRLWPPTTQPVHQPVPHPGPFWTPECLLLPMRPPPCHPQLQAWMLSLKSPPDNLPRLPHVHMNRDLQPRPRRTLY